MSIVVTTIERLLASFLRGAAPATPLRAESAEIMLSGLTNEPSPMTP